MLRKRNDLTADKFEALLLRLDLDRDLAAQKYEEIRWKLIKLFQWSSCTDAEHLVDETFNRVAEKLVSRNEDISDVAAFAWGIAKKVRQEAIRLHSRTVPLSGMPSAENHFVDIRSAALAQTESPGGESRLRCLRSCIRLLAPEDRKLVLRYHSPKGRRVEGRRQLAQETGMTMVALRVRANRLRFKLEECIRKCLASRAG